MSILTISYSGWRWRDGGELIQYGRLADVARVDDEIAAAQEGQRLGAKRAVGVGDQTCAVQRAGRSDALWLWRKAGINGAW